MNKIEVCGTVFEAGCYADDCLGHGNVRGVLADYVQDIVEDVDLADELRGCMSDDASEEYDAIDKMNEVTSGGYWVIDNGLLLVEKGSELDQALNNGA